MSTPDNSGSAFPEKPIGMDCTTAGLTKREYFAIRFAAAVVANTDIPQEQMTANRVAEFSCDFADALLKRLEATQ